MDVQVVEAHIRARALGDGDLPVRGGCGAHLGDGAFERSETVDDGLVVGQRGVGRDEEGQG
jgi:hypothetical protein